MRAVVVDCQDPEKCASFWRTVLGTGIEQPWRDAHGVEYVQVELGEGTVLLFQPVPEERSGKNRLHLDLVPDGGTQAEELERLRGLGATVLADRPELPWVVLADPEGNEFCLLPPGS